MREGYKLTEWAQAERDDFEDKYGSEGSCSCHLYPPCGSCTHPGNPRSQEEDDGAWEVDGPVVRAAESDPPKLPANPPEEWFQEPSAGRQILTLEVPEPLDPRMCAPAKEPPGPMRVERSVIARRRKARKTAEASRKKNRR